MTTTAPPVLRLLPVPAAEPRPAERLHLERRSVTLPGQGALALDWATAPPEPPAPHLPDARRWVAHFVRVAVEVATGHRPAGQLARWTSDEVFTHLSRRHLLSRRLDRAPHPPTYPVTVRAVRVCAPSEAVIEAGAVVGDRDRIRAVAVRLEGRTGRWRATALEIGG